MTPKVFLTSDGEPFPATVLDDRAGVPAGQGTYQLAQNGDQVERLPSEVFAVIEQHGGHAETQIENGEFRAAFDSLIAALEELPSPSEQWNAAGWLLVAMGENAFRSGSFEAAKNPLEDAMYCPGTLGNPWVHMRLGQVHFELANTERATDNLARAYMGGGRDVFQNQDPKYFDLVASVLKPPPGMSELP